MIQRNLIIYIIIKVDKLIFNSCSVFIFISNQLFVYLEKFFNEEKLFLVKDILMDRL